MRHLGEAVEQRVAGDPHVVEPDAPVVDAVQPFLRAAILDADARGGRAGIVPDGDQEGVHAVVLEGEGPRRGRRGVCAGRGSVVRGGAIPANGHTEPREDGGHAPVQRGVADVVLARVVVRGGDHEFARRGVVGGRRAEVPDVGAVAGLGHGVAPGKFQRRDPGQVAAMVLFRPQLCDAAAEEPELHAVLDQDAEVAQRELLEDGNRAARVALAPVFARVRDRAQPRLRQHVDGREGALAVLAARNLVRDVQLGTAQRGPHPGPQRGVVATNQCGDLRRDVWGWCGGGAGDMVGPGDVPEGLRSREAEIQLHLTERGEGVVAPGHRFRRRARRTGFRDSQARAGQGQGAGARACADRRGGRAEDGRGRRIGGVQPVAYPGPSPGRHPVRVLDCSADRVELLVLHEAVGPHRAEHGKEREEGRFPGDAGELGSGHEPSLRGEKYARQRYRLSRKTASPLEIPCPVRQDRLFPAISP